MSFQPSRTRRLHSTLLLLPILPIVAVLSAGGTVGQEKNPDAEPIPAPAAAEAGNPMANFARWLPGAWRQTANTGTTMDHTWNWGPGQHSMRRMTEGADAGGGPWRQVEVYYWHPERKQIRLLGVSPFARGIAEGTLKFERETAEGAVDLYQLSARRKMVLRWSFDGPDRVRETLLEAVGSAGLQPLVEFELIRSGRPATKRPPTAEEPPQPSQLPKALEALVGHVWEAKGDWAAGGSFHIRSTFEWIPYADAIYMRTIAPSGDGEPLHLFDVYFYRHTGTNAQRCLALSDRGGVYEGDLTELEGGALQVDLQGYEGGKVVRHAVRFDFEKNGTLRQRIWSGNGADRTLLLDVHHQKLNPQKR